MRCARATRVSIRWPMRCRTWSGRPCPTATTTTTTRAGTNLPASRRASTDGEGWNGMFHPDDQERAWAVWRRCLDDRRALRDRIPAPPSQRRISLDAGAGDADARRATARSFAGSAPAPTSTIPSGQREQNEILSRELSHRIKNIFAVIGGLVGLSARQHPGTRRLPPRFQPAHRGARAGARVRPPAQRGFAAGESRGDACTASCAEILAPYPALSRRPDRDRRRRRRRSTTAARRRWPC